ncbi:WD40-repeat-containing domain [Phytophthora cinnamomi]|uniref:WD40-repeat-containing domain n=1 Tax=Phytophthora cinnamomi TaxID=4785 RepID=UPI0035598610|nr:WD40-repeat-containing domain [Phytophthora cinnamomi]
MSRVNVVVVPAEAEEPRSQQDGSESSKQRKYTGWIPPDYSVGQLKHDIGRYWQLKVSKYELCDPLGSVLDDDKPLELSYFDPAVLQLRRCVRVLPVLDEKASFSANTTDPFWIHDQLYDLFVFNALQNRPSSTLRITSYQFKQLLQKTTVKRVYQQKKKLLFDKRVTLAFRGAQTNPSSSGDGGAGASFDEFLDALVDVACFMYPREQSKELALEKLATEHIIPYYETEQTAAGPDTLSWAQIDELAEHPVVFCGIIDLLTAKHTGAHNISIFSGDCVYPRKHSCVKPSSGTRKGSTSSPSERDRLRAKRTGAADCIVVLGGKMTQAAGIDVSYTTSPSDIRLEPEVIDVLPSRASLPEELSKFCFPDDIYLSTEPFSPRTFDIVLTDIKGVRSYGSCLHFCEEKHPMDVLSLISATQKGRTVNLPSWVSLKDIQQGQTKWKCYAPKCLCVLSSTPLFQTFRTFLVYLYRLSLASSTSIPLESILFNFLERTPLPTANTTQTAFKLGDTTCLLSGFPRNLPLFSPTEVDFTILFQCLNPDNILKVYGYLLTEKKIVLSSTNRPILTHVAETLRALLHPFECQQVYIPLLPLSLVEFICAPVPFFMGIRSDQRLERLMAEGVILVDLDNNDIRLPPNEELPLLTDVKSRKLLHTLRKLSIWPASQRTRYSFGRGLTGSERPISASFEPSQPSDAEVNQVVSRHEDLSEKWSEIQTLFSSFALRLLKEIRKHCTKVPAPAVSGSNSESVLFDERSFLAMHPSLREFCTHLFQTQLFQRSIENIWTLNDGSSAAEPEQYWKAVRAKSMLRKNSDISEDTNKTQRRQVVQAPLPPRKHTNPISSTKSANDGFPAFNGQLYDDLLEELGDSGDLESSACDFAAQTVRPLSSLGLSSEASSTSILTSPSFHDGDADAFKLVNAARRRLEGRRGGEITE